MKQVVATWTIHLTSRLADGIEETLKSNDNQSDIEFGSEQR